MNKTKHVIGKCIAHDPLASIPVRNEYDINGQIVSIPFEEIMKVIQITIRSQLTRLENAVRMTQGMQPHERLCTSDIDSTVHAAKNLATALTLRNHLLYAQERKELHIVHMPDVPESANGNSSASASTLTLRYI